MLDNRDPIEAGACNEPDRRVAEPKLYPPKRDEPDSSCIDVCYEGQLMWAEVVSSQPRRGLIAARISSM
jgi:hypothetical protein